MPQRRSKRHHFVPIVLQKRFEFGPDKIWYAEKNVEGRFTDVEKRNHKSAFWEKNYNTTMEDGQPSDRLETGFWGNVDDYLGRLIPEIEDALEKDGNLFFSGSPWESMRRLFAVLMKRSPDILPDYDPLELGNEVTCRVLELLPQLSESEKGCLESKERKVQNGRHILAEARTGESNRVIAALQEYEVRFVRPQARSSFILGSRMVHRIRNGGDGRLDNPDTELWFPISPRITVVLLRPGRETPHIVEFPKESVRKFNEYVCRSSSRVGSHSDKLLRSLTRSHAPCR